MSGKRACMILLLMAVMLGGTDLQSSAQMLYDEGYGTEAAQPADIFYLPLSPYGKWVQHDVYGLAWFPQNVPAGWRPYTVGHWIGTDYGWTWVSDEPWGWAVYHYGRWLDDDKYGWLWFPDSIWGPAWVIWRYSQDWIGWAPMPPELIWNNSAGLDFTYTDIENLLPYSRFCFVETTQFIRIDIIKFIVIPKFRHDFVKDNKAYVHYRKRGDKIVNYLPEQARIQQATREPIQKVTVVETALSERHGQKGDEVFIYRPRQQGVRVLRNFRQSVGEDESRKTHRDGQREKFQGKTEIKASGISAKPSESQSSVLAKGSDEQKTEKQAIPVAATPRYSSHQEKERQQGPVSSGQQRSDNELIRKKRQDEVASQPKQARNVETLKDDDKRNNEKSERQWREKSRREQRKFLEREGGEELIKRDRRVRAKPDKPSELDYTLPGSSVRMR